MATGTRRVTDKYKWISAGGGALEIGTSSVPLNVKTASDPLVQLYTTSALTAGNSQSMEINQVMTAANTAGYAEALMVNLTAAVKTGAWVNAIFGRTAYTSNGRAYGSASAICGEMSWPASGAGNGTYSVFQAEIDIPTTTGSQVGAIGSVFSINLWGDGASKFDDNGYLFSLQGFTPADGGVIDSSLSAATGDGGIRIRIGASNKWLLYADDNS
ncbi:hypothetical protein LCGC14_2657150 [marine sediment metagenome]|uniref:Uncharacterized protein n=1 Tax=marine sediment metagenome TaxID=412755 RepID=A0A0F8ZT71_9ZZZZ